MAMDSLIQVALPVPLCLAEAGPHNPRGPSNLNYSMILGVRWCQVAQELQDFQPAYKDYNGVASVFLNLSSV